MFSNINLFELGGASLQDNNVKVIKVAFSSVFEFYREWPGGQTDGLIGVFT